jgi:hypothetical protein
MRDPKAEDNRKIRSSLRESTLSQRKKEGVSTTRT